MASPAQLTPPPGMDPSGPTPAPTSPAAASPSPAQPSPMNQGTQMAIRVVSDLRSIAKAYPKAAPIVSQINDLMRQVMAAMMSEGQTGEPQAPPSAG